MLNYNKIITSLVAVSSTRMLIGASSTIYMLVSGLNLYDVGVIKSVQALVILFFGFFVGLISDRMERKWLQIIATLFATLWLFIFYLAGVEGSYQLFLLAEILNALSLAIYQNNTNAYLADQFYIDKPEGNLKEAFGKLGKQEFLFMAVLSLIGGGLYSLYKSDLFLAACLIMLLILFLSLFFLPQQPRKHKKQKMMIEKNEILIIFRKFARFKLEIIIFLLVGLYFQIIIQYWQPIVYKFELIKNNEYYLGVILFLMFLVQSMAGKMVESHSNFSLRNAAIIFLIGGVLSVFSFIVELSLLYVVGLCISLFSIRFCIIRIDALIHSNLLSCLRAKYDMFLDTILRIATALSLLLVGFLSNLYSVNVINFIGVVIGGFFVLFALFPHKQRDVI